MGRPKKKNKNPSQKLAFKVPMRGSLPKPFVNFFFLGGKRLWFLNIPQQSHEMKKGISF